MGKIPRKRQHLLLAALLFMLILGTAGLGLAGSEGILSRGQLLYVPVYSHIYGGDKAEGYEFYLTAILSLRNTDQGSPITFIQVDYYDADGRLVKKFLDKPVTLAPFSSSQFIVKESDTKGGLGAKFLVRWQADKTVNAPLVETVMIGTKMQQGISFTSRAIVLKESP
jgi:hypothetical protein